MPVRKPKKMSFCSENLTVKKEKISVTDKTEGLRTASLLFYLIIYNYSNHQFFLCLIF